MFRYEESLENLKPHYQQGSTEVKNHLALSKRQRKLEEKLADKLSQCPISKEIISKNMPNIDAEKIKDKTLVNFYDDNVISSVACISENLIAVSPEWKNYLKSYITNLKKIRVNSVTGDAYYSDLKNSNNNTVANKLFVIKEAQEKVNNLTVLHESMVGMLALNNLRKTIPNFACIYGFFNCGNTINNDLCRNDEYINHIIYENIDNSKSMGDIIKEKSINSEKYLQYLIQFLYALKIANEKYKFTHYDLHPGNILVRKIPQVSLIKYKINNRDIYVKTDEIVTFIDYGFSYVEGKFDNIPYKLGCNEFFYNNCVYSDKDFLIHDVFKFIAFSMYDSYLKGDYMQDLMIPLLSYFIIPDQTLSYQQILVKLKRSLFSAPYNDQTKNFNIDQFIDYVLELIRKNNWNSGIVTPQAGDKLLFCADSNCPSLKNTMNSIGIKVKSLASIADIYNYTEDELDTSLSSVQSNYNLFNLIQKRYLVVYYTLQSHQLKLNEINQYGVDKVGASLQQSNTYAEFLTRLNL